MFLSISPSIIRCVAIAAATPELAQRRSAREGAASGLGGHLRHRPHAGLAGTPRPGAILHMSWVNKVSVARRTARSLAYPPAEAEAGNRRAAFPARPTEEFAAGPAAPTLSKHRLPVADVPQSKIGGRFCRRPQRACHHAPARAVHAAVRSRAGLSPLRCVREGR